MTGNFDDYAQIMSAFGADIFSCLIRVYNATFSATCSSYSCKIYMKSVEHVVTKYTTVTKRYQSINFSRE